MPFEAELQLTFTEAPDYGDVIPLEEFVESVKSGLFGNDDGTGYYSYKDGRMSNVLARPSDIFKGLIDSRLPWTQVVWFNK